MSKTGYRPRYTAQPIRLSLGDSDFIRGNPADSPEPDFTDALVKSANEKKQAWQKGLGRLFCNQGSNLEVCVAIDHCDDGTDQVEEAIGEVGKRCYP